MNKKGFAPILIILLVIVVAGLIGVGYTIFKRGSVSTQFTPTKKPSSLESTSDLVYEDSEGIYSFSYPSDWKVVGSVAPDDFMYNDPTNKEDWINYYNTPEGLNLWLKGKMFAGECRGPIIQNIENPNLLIAIEVVDVDSDGAFCWSSGYFFEENKWSVGENYMYPITMDNSGKLTNVEWRGDFFKYQPLGQNSKLRAFAGLVNRETYTLLGEDVLSKIVSTFKFTK